MPTDTVRRPTVAASFTSIFGQSSQNHAHCTVLQTARKTDATTYVPQDNGNIASFEPAQHPQHSEMARLRAAPTPSTKPSLVTAPTTLRQTSPAPYGDPTYTTHRKIEASSPRRPEISHGDLKAVSKAASPRTTNAADVEVLDLTDDLSSLIELEEDRVPPQLAGRKRKSEEYRADLPRKQHAPERQIRQSPPPAFPELSDSEDFATIDDLDLAPSEPPPPYSTVAPKSTTKRATSPALPPIKPVPSPICKTPFSDDLVNQSSSASGQLLPSTALTGLSSDEDLLLKSFLKWTPDDLSLQISKAERDHASAVERYIEAFADDDDENDVSRMKEDADRLDTTRKTLYQLRQFNDRFGVLDLQKKDLMQRMKKAMLAGQDTESLTEALSGIKKAVQQTKLECLPFVKQVDTLIRKCSPPSPVRPAKGDFDRHNSTHGRSSDPLRIQQTQLQARTERIRSPSRSPLRQEKRVGDLRTARDLQSEHSDDFTPNHVPFSSPPRKGKTRVANTGKENRPTPYSARDEFDYGENLFSTVMGTPPAQIVGDEDEYDDFGDEEQQLIDLAQSSTTGNVFRDFAKESHGLASFGQNIAKTQDARNTSSNKKSESTYGHLMRHPWSQDVKKVLGKTFRLRGFRPNQLEAINATLAGKDVFVLMPTGGGKSLCYQLPSVVSSGKTKGVTIVISPLLSLMEDQVNHLKKLHIQAFIINGQTSKEEKDQIFSAFNDPKADQFVQLLYVTPEMLTKNQRMVGAFVKLHNNGKLARIVIDEAHCVSQWGHDFRPDYKELGEVRRQFPGVPVMALTATATENVKVDVMHNLQIERCEVFTQSFNRPNLYYEIRSKGKNAALVQDIAATIKAKYVKQSGIVYCLSRKTCETVAGDLQKQGIKAHHYHAAMEPEDKSKVQRLWQAGKYQVIVATIAFGMGIDKPDVRFVIHHSIPKSLEGYYQETGRAGRDGKRSGCYLYYGYQDTKVLQKMIDESEGSREQKERQRNMLRKMVQYCENTSDCRRAQVLAYFNESFPKDACNAECDVCDSTTTFETRDVTEYAARAVKLVAQLSAHGNKVTLLYCLDVFRGSRSSKITNNGDDQLDGFGAGEDLDRGEAERMFHRLVTEDAITEVNVVNKRGFANQYVDRGARYNAFASGREKVLISMRVSSPRGKSKSTNLKATKSGGKARAIDHPMSTNVSSPAQAMTKRKATRPERARAAVDSYKDPRAIASDSEDGDYAEDTDSNDGFEPVRQGPVARINRVSRTGPPITTDEKMDRLDDVHRDVVEQFVQDGKQLGQKLLMKHSLREVPFSETILREMAISFPVTTLEIAKIPDIDPSKAHHYGPHYVPLIKKYKEAYKDMMRDAPVADPNHENVIDLVSDDEEYGSVNDSDFEADEPDQRSAYFSRETQVADFNNAMASQSQGRQAMPPPRRPSLSPTPERQFGRRSRSVSGSGRGGFRKGGFQKRASGGGGGGGARKGRSGGGGIAKKKAASRKAGGSTTNSLQNFVYNEGGARGTSKKRTGGISMMPT